MLMIYMTLMDDEEDKSKFEEIYHEYSKLMRYRAYEILKDQHLAEDAVHQAFLKIINNLNKISSVKCNKTKHFLVVVVERVAIDIYNKNHKKDIISYDELEEKQQIGVNSDLLEQANLNDIEKIIYQLPDTYREIFILKYSNECSNREIAKLLNLKEGTICQRLARGKEVLAERLKEVGIYE